VADLAPKIRVIAATAFQETLRRKVLYVVVVLMVLIGVITVASSAMLRLAQESGEAEVGDAIRSGIVANVLAMWSTATFFLAVFLGAIGLSSELTARTLVSVLSRPIDRWAYLTGRWLGVLSFLWAFQLLGAAIGMGLALALHAKFAPTLWLGLVGLFVNATLLSGVSLALSVVAPPILAGIGAFLLPGLPQLAEALLKIPRWYVRWPAFAVYYLSPAKMPVNLIGDSFTKELIHPTYGLYSRVLAENFLFALVVVAIGCAIFARRELKLR
jgi:ABC-type transport system involved in multi-copper enzyme maturation permease subunit